MRALHGLRGSEWHSAQKKELNIKRKKRIGDKKFLCYTPNSLICRLAGEQFSKEGMLMGNGSSRRSFFKLMAAAPLLSQIAARDLYANAAKAIGGAKENVYTRLGVKTIINCRGTWTYLSGSLEFPEVRQAQLAAAEYFVNVLDLQRAVGRRLAELTGAESGMVTSGSAGAMAVAPLPAWRARMTH